MKILDKIPYLIIAGFVYLLIYSSCANQGMPTGGPRDSIPPVLIKTEPGFAELNFEGDEVQLTFDEYIVYDKVTELLVVSPPLKKRPTIKMKSKTLILQFNEELQDSVTYSIDFKNSIEDNNEKNPYKSLRFSFSTWDVYDSLRVAGIVKSAINLNPVDKALVMLYKNLHDTAIYSLVPDYIAKTNEEGLFLIDNIAPGKYNIFSINDANSDMKYNEGAEEVAFIDTLIIPEAHFHEELDTIASGADSMLISGHVHFLPEPVYLLQSMEDIFNQFRSADKRESKYKCSFIFEESVEDTFGINLLNTESDNWYSLETNPTFDSLTVWITDTLIANIDTINVELLYNQLDSSENLYLFRDTLDLVFTEPKKEVPKRKKKSDKEVEEVKIPQFNINHNLKSSGFDLNIPVVLKSPEPLKHFYKDQIHLYLDSDTTGTPLEFQFEKDTSAWRQHIITYQWEANTQYRLEIDSAASENIYGITNRKLIQKFKTQKDDYYGTIILEMENVEGPVIVQLLKNDKEETLVKSQSIDRNGEISFIFLAPGKYILRAIYDVNGNGEWDQGSFAERIQPEKMSYLQKVLKVRSNWDNKETWDLTIDPTYPKVLYDKEVEEQKKKALEEERKKKEQQKSGGNNSQRNSTGSSSSFNSLRR